MSLKALHNRVRQAARRAASPCPGVGVANRLRCDDGDGPEPEACVWCGGSHVFEIVEVIVTPDGREVPVSEYRA